MQYADYTCYNRAVENAAKDLGLDISLVDSVYRAYCKLIIERLSELPLKKDLTEEEFNKLQTSVTFPSIGKFYCTWKTYTGELKRREYVQKAKENKAAKHRSVSNDDSI